MGGGGEDVKRLAGREQAMVRRIRPGHGGLCAQHLERPFLGGLRADDADHVFFQRDLVHDGQPVAAPEDIEGRGVVTAVDADRPLAAQPERGGATAVDVHRRPRRRRADQVGAPADPLAAELHDLDVRSAQLGAAGAVDDGHADGGLRGGAGRREQHGGHGDEKATHRRPKSQNRRVRITETTSDVTTGK
jgi:hypothetical protein